MDARRQSDRWFLTVLWEQLAEPPRWPVWMSGMEGGGQPYVRRGEVEDDLRGRGGGEFRDFRLRRRRSAGAGIPLSPTIRGSGSVASSTWIRSGGVRWCFRRPRSRSGSAASWLWFVCGFLHVTCARLCHTLPFGFMPYSPWHPESPCL